MKNHLLLLIMLSFLISGCSNRKINNPYEIAKGTSVLSYYDTEDDVDIDEFNFSIPENPIEIGDPDENRIVIIDGKIRCIYIADEEIVTYNQISVGDKIEKIENSFQYEYSSGNIYSVFFNGNVEVDAVNQDQEDTWIEIIYHTDKSRITSIMICDLLYGREAR